MKRVVITGFGALSPIGHDWATVHDRLRSRRNAIQHIADWDAYEGLNTRLGAPAAPFDLPAHYNRKSTRSMGRVALLVVTMRPVMPKNTPMLTGAVCAIILM